MCIRDRHDGQEGKHLVLFDEPASGLDSTEAERFGDLVQEIAASHEAAILLVEHNVGFVMQRCHRVVVLHLGKVLADGTPEQVREDPLVLSAYLGASTKMCIRDRWRAPRPRTSPTGNFPPTAPSS